MNVFYKMLCFFFIIFTTSLFCQGEKNNKIVSAVIYMDSISVPSWQIKSGKPLELDSANVLYINTLLDKFIDSSNNGDTTIQAMGQIGHFQYDRQLIPHVNLKNEKTVWINCFCNIEEHPYSVRYRDLNSGMILVDDGGNCYFSVFLNLENNKFYDLYVNGF